MIVDCFTFSNEFDVLELRLRTLDDVVDRFVLCEAPFTFRGGPKPLYFQANAERFARWRDRITVVTYPGPPDPDPWVNEHRQRDFLVTGLAGCEPDDLILMGDVDEIPLPANVAARPQPGGVVVHCMMLLRGYVNRADGHGEAGFTGTRAMAYGDIPNLFGGRFSVLRISAPPHMDVVYGGWHFTSLGGVDVLREKMQSYSHTEYDVPYYSDRFRLVTEYDSIGGPASPTTVPIEKLPEAIREPYWQRYVWQPRRNVVREEGQQLEHAHGLFGYVPDDGTPVGVLAPTAGMWDDAAAERFPDRYAGRFVDVRSLTEAGVRPAWLIIDPLEAFAPGLLGECAAIGANTIAFATNARSLQSLAKVVRGEPFGRGRALGRAEIEHEIGAARLPLRRLDGIANRQIQWARFAPGETRNFDGALPPFSWHDISAGRVHDFQTNGFVAVLGAGPSP